MRRFSRKTPGHDCIRNPCGRRGCGTRPGASHGVSSEQWHYAVSAGSVALSLRVSSNVYPASVPRDSLEPRVPEGVYLCIHHAFPVSEEQLLGQPEECEYLDGGVCYGDEGSSIQAHDFFEQHGGPQFSQPESFWEAFEAEARARATQLQSERVDGHLVRCPHCHGSGVVATARAGSAPAAPTTEGG